MPIYEYQCKDCGTEFEKRVSMSTPTSEIDCPQCGERHSERIMSVFAPSGVSGARSEAPPCVTEGRCAPRNGFS